MSPNAATRRSHTLSTPGGNVSRVTRLANEIRALHHQERRGDLAALRRMNPDRPYEDAFQRLLVKIAPNADFATAHRLALFVSILALPTRADALLGGRNKLGRAMAEAGVTNRRVQTLMTARGPTLDALLVRLARRLLREGHMPYEEIGSIVLGEEPELEETRFSVAKGYWTERVADDDEELSNSDVDGDD